MCKHKLTSSSERFGDKNCLTDTRKTIQQQRRNCKLQLNKMPAKNRCSKLEIAIQLTSSSWTARDVNVWRKETIPEQRTKKKHDCLAKRRSVGIFFLLDQRNCKQFDNTVLCRPIAEELQMQSTRVPRNRAHNLSWSGDQGLATVAQGVNWGKTLQSHFRINT